MENILNSEPLSEIIKILEWHVPASLYTKGCMIQNLCIQSLLSIAQEVIELAGYQNLYTSLKYSDLKRQLVLSFRMQVLPHNLPRLGDLLKTMYYSSPYYHLRVQKIREAIEAYLQEAEARNVIQIQDLTQEFKMCFNDFLDSNIS